MPRMTKAEADAILAQLEAQGVKKEDAARWLERNTTPPGDRAADPGTVAFLAGISAKTNAETIDMRHPKWRAGYWRGVIDAMRRAAEMEPGEIASALREADRLK